MTNGYQLGRSEAEQIQAVLNAVNDLLDLGEMFMLPATSFKASSKTIQRAIADTPT